MVFSAFFKKKTERNKKIPHFMYEQNDSNEVTCSRSPWCRAMNKGFLTPSSSTSQHFGITSPPPELCVLIMSNHWSIIKLDAFNHILKQCFSNTESTFESPGILINTDSELKVWDKPNITHSNKLPGHVTLSNKALDHTYKKINDDYNGISKTLQDPWWV